MSDVSVLVPSYNHADYIERTLKSIFNQSLQPSKLLVIDDGSTDGSVDVIKNALEDCPFDSELISRDNHGLCRTLNEGFSLLKGSFFAYIGSDDIWFPRFLEESINVLNERPEACLSFCHAYVVDKDDFIIDRTDEWVDFTNVDARSHLRSGNVFSSPGVVYRRGLMPTDPWDEEARLEDYDLYLRLSSKHQFAHINETLCAWRQHDTNTSENLPIMFPEILKAHHEAFASEEQDYQTLKKKVAFDAAFNFVRYGYRKEALKMMIENIGGAKSTIRVLDLLFRITIPKNLFRWNRKRKQNKAREQYGKLDDLIARS